MTAANLAVDVSPRDGEATLWVRVVAFGKLAEALARHAKGESLSAAGRMELSRWTDAEGNARDNWQLIAESLGSARTVRPGGGRRGAGGDTRGDAPDGAAPSVGEGEPFNDAWQF
jgi:single-stranded DNA-binding protein